MEKLSSKRSRAASEASGEGSSSSPVLGSVVLSSILSEHQLTWEEFLNHIWQKQIYYFDSKILAFPTSTAAVLLADEDAGRWRDEHMQSNAWAEMVLQGWNILSELLEARHTTLAACKKNESQAQPCIHEHEFPLIFQNQRVKSREDVEASYGDNLFAAYLDGCSIVFNHADLLNPYLAFLCQDLQQQRADLPGFPHAYANCYLTPPNSQTAPPHADDRDVFIYQLVGQKRWQVYSQVPILYPFTHEQVGKDGLDVPLSIIQGPKAFEGTIHPGDVLYLPRGMVHQAQSTSDTLSFHITVALATHDWTLAGNLARQIQTKLMRTVDFRTSILPLESSNREAAIAKLQMDVDQAFRAMQKEITAQSLMRNIEERIEIHNREAFSSRMSLIHTARVVGEIDYDTTGTTINNNAEIHETPSRDQCVGSSAAKNLKYNSRVRAATRMERAYAQGMMKSNNPPGLHVREEIADTVSEIISRIKVSTGTNETFQVNKLRSLVENPHPSVCDLTLLSVAKRAVQLGAIAVVI
jgi:ribosomal protein L16 Arg81 hydroxylase